MTMDRNVGLVATSLLEVSWWWMKVVVDPSRKNPKWTWHIPWWNRRVGSFSYWKKSQSLYRCLRDIEGLLSSPPLGCANPTFVDPTVIFTISYMPLNLKLIIVPKAHIPKSIKLLKEKVNMIILESSNAPYSNRWFMLQTWMGPQASSNTFSQLTILFFFQRFSSIVLRKNAQRLQLELVYPKAYNFLCTMMYNNPKCWDCSNFYNA